jgi:hypothetical protein
LGIYLVKNRRQVYSLAFPKVKNLTQKFSVIRLKHQTVIISRQAKRQTFKSSIDFILQSPKISQSFSNSISIRNHQRNQISKTRNLEKGKQQSYHQKDTSQVNFKSFFVSILSLAGMEN